MEVVNFVIRGRKAVKDLVKSAEAGHFIGARWEVKVPELRRLAGAPRLAAKLNAFQEKYHGKFLLNIEPSKKLDAAATISKSLRSAAKLINEGGGYIKGVDNYLRLTALANTIRQAANRLPRKEKQSVRRVCTELARAARAGKKAGGRRRSMLKVAKKMEALQSSRLTLLRAPAA